MVNINITDVRTIPGDSGFLIDDGKTAILYDSGFGFTGHGLTENIKEALGDRTLDYIFLTHSHYDHVLGSVQVAKTYPGVKVVAGAYAAEVFKRTSALETMGKLDRIVAQTHGVQSRENEANALRVDIAVKDGDTVTCGDLHFRVVGLPGHTKCSVGFYLEDDRLLLGTETLGVYFGQDTYLPSCLVGYQMTLDAYQKVKGLDIAQMLLPHWGVVEQEEAMAYLEKCESISRETAHVIKDQLQAGKTREEIAADLEAKLYKENVAPIYPIEAFRMNTGHMIELIRKELSI